LFKRKNFITNDLKLNLIFKDFDESYQNHGFSCEKIIDIYGIPFIYQKYNSKRPLIWGMFVSSIDGKIAFQDNTDGSLVARNNFMDTNGGLSDFWLMNMLRSQADAVLIGNNTLKHIINATGHIFDEDLENCRLYNRLSKIPYNILVSNTGKNIPYDHNLFKNQEIPIVIGTSSEGYKYICKNSNLKYYSNITFIVEGDNSLHTPIFMEKLKSMGINKVVIEAKSYFDYLIKHNIVDEIFLSISGVYAGGSNILGDAFTFSSDNHPHFKIVSIHTHKNNFLFIRYSNQSKCSIKY
jgi:riboflavin biosynthesis pyrimidine reductase